jgi:hypothetical protein
MIMPGHVPIWRQILGGSLPATGDWLTIGVQDVHSDARQEPGFDFPTVTALLQSRGAVVRSLDFFDQRANFQHDLNHALPSELCEQFDVLLDIGSMEHIFDTRQVFCNYLAAVKAGGYLCLHLPVSGYYRHGLHTFSPELIRGVLIANGCEITFTTFSDHRGTELGEDNLRGVDALMWVVAVKSKPVAEFRIPQQDGWRGYYDCQLSKGQ